MQKDITAIVQHCAAAGLSAQEALAFVKSEASMESITADIAARGADSRRVRAAVGDDGAGSRIVQACEAKAAGVDHGTVAQLDRLSEGRF